MVGERGFEPPTPWSRTDNATENQQLTICVYRISAPEMLLNLIDGFQLLSFGYPSLGTLPSRNRLRVVPEMPPPLLLPLLVLPPPPHEVIKLTLPSSQASSSQNGNPVLAAWRKKARMQASTALPTASHRDPGRRGQFSSS